MVQYIYTLGAAGERLSVNELDRTVEYTYDSLYRLTSETITDENGTTVYTYAYDSVSNRTLKTENGTETAYVYNALNQLVSDSDTSYEYDLNGNLVRVIGTDKSALYEFNAENKLVKATVQNGNLVTVETYTYDYAGNRTSKTTTSSNGSVEYVKYLNDNSALTNVLAEIGSDGSVQAYYTIGADLISQERNGVVYTYLYDGHVSVVGMTNESGRVTDTYVYDAFGNLIDSTGSTKNYYRYCGEQFDETTGLYYLRARYMDTTTGRFISQDSYAGSISDPTSLHKYLYANANPVMYSDPSGYMTLAETVTVSAIISGMTSSLINVSAYLDGLCSLSEFDFSNAFMAAFEGFMDGMIIGALSGVAVYGLSALCVLCPALEGIIVASEYATALWGSLYAIVSGYQSAEKGNYFSAVTFSLIGFGTLYTLLQSLFSYTPSDSGGTPPDSSENSSNSNSSSGNSDARYRYGNAVTPMEKTYEMALNPEMYANEVAKKYGINLKGSGQKITIVYNPDLVQAGKTYAANPNVIEIGPSAFVSEEELANTIAHELNHARSFIKGGNAPEWGEGGAYLSGDALADYIKGGR